MSLEDKICVDKYLSLISSFLEGRITVGEFETQFLDSRRRDQHWMSGALKPSIGKILDTLFLDVDEYTPPELFDKGNPFNISEQELLERVAVAEAKLRKAILDDQ